MGKIIKPIHRTRLRQIVGKEYFILKRKFNGWFSQSTFSTKRTFFDDIQEKHSVFHHKSMILRPLVGVDMQLQENKRTNLELAIKHLNGVVILPGEVFSIWKLVGRPTKQKGYLDGLVLKKGQVSIGTGGGLCQLGNLLFWVFAHSPLIITERYRHGYDVFPGVNRKVPFGAGATLAYNYIDLQVVNNTNQSFRIALWIDETHLNGELFSENKLKTTYVIEERNHRMDQQIWGGYSRHNQIFKITKENDDVTEELLVENHAIMMYEPFLE